MAQRECSNKICVNHGLNGVFRVGTICQECIEINELETKCENLISENQRLVAEIKEMREHITIKE